MCEFLDAVEYTQKDMLKFFVYVGYKTADASHWCPLYR